MKPCGTVAGTSFLFSICNENRCKSLVFAPYKQALHPLKLFFFKTYSSGIKMKCPFVLSDNFLELRCNLEMLKTPAKCLRFCPFLYITPLSV